MPPILDSMYEQSDSGLTITTRTWPGDDRRIHVCLAGEIDRDSSDVLSKTVDWLSTVAPVSVLVDLSGLTFVGSALPNFVAQARHAMPDGSELILSRARPATAWVLRTTNMATIATICDEPSELLRQEQEERASQPVQQPPSLTPLLGSAGEVRIPTPVPSRAYDGHVSTHEQDIDAAGALAEQREIDAQVRDSEAGLECDELRNEQRSIIQREFLADEREYLADARDLRLDARERQLDDQERRGHMHQLDLADRVDQVTQREKNADQRETHQAQVCPTPKSPPGWR